MKLLITLKKSPISSLQVHKDTVAALGLRKIGQTVEKEDNPSIRGQIFRVRHMVEVKEVPGTAEKKQAPKAETVAKEAAPKAEKAVKEVAPKAEKAVKEAAPKAKKAVKEATADM
ncbi:MAG: 50S ribosomal protein L30 [Clostridiales bacterium]|nr:50S ribosomal protein L30 [Clostridiales bacterium]